MFNFVVLGINRVNVPVVTPQPVTLCNKKFYRSGFCAAKSSNLRSRERPEKEKNVRFSTEYAFFSPLHVVPIA